LEHEQGQDCDGCGGSKGGLRKVVAEFGQRQQHGPYHVDIKSIHRMQYRRRAFELYLTQNDSIEKNLNFHKRNYNIVLPRLGSARLSEPPRG